MRIRGVILPAFDAHFGNDPMDLPMQKVGNLPYLEWQVQQLQKLNKEPIVIIGSGTDADELLSQCPSLVHVSMVYAKEELRSAVEILQVGIDGAGRVALYLPLSVPTPPPKVWNDLEREFFRLSYRNEIELLVPTFEGKKGYPWIITENGKDVFSEKSLIGMSGEFLDLETQLVPVTSSLIFEKLESIQDFQSWKSLYTS